MKAVTITTKPNGTIELIEAPLESFRLKYPKFNKPKIVKPILVASARAGVHQVEIYKPRFTQTFVYARVRKATFVEPPTFKTFMSAIFRLAHERLNQ